MPIETALAQQEPATPAVRRYALKSAAPARKGLVDYDRDLSDEQRAVAQCDPRPTLVIAGAGSGKTRALTYRVAHLLESGAAPEKILLLTFTNKSAREMMSRVGQLCRVETRKMWGGTFHHVAHGLLREHASRLGYADRFGLLDREDAKEVMASATADLGFGVGQRRFPRPDALIDLYSAAINTQRPLAEVIAKESPQFVALEDEILKVARRFAERKAQMNAMDFDDLLLNWKRLLVEVPAARESIMKRFSAVLVDEYQDTNRLQGEIVDAMAASHGNLLVVGDDAQSIYGFRGAHFENILKFPERYPQCQQFRLLTNYRSTPPILALANASIACNRKQFQKELRPHREGGVLPALVPLRDVHQQAEFVAQRILELREEGIPLREMAVLYRAHTHSMELQMELARRGIPFLVRAGVRFFEQAHIKDVLAHLKFIQNPHDELSFKRIVKLVPGIGAASADALWAQVEQWLRQGREARTQLDSLAQLVPPKARAGLRALGAALQALLSMRSQPSEMIRCILHEGGYGEALKQRYANAQARADDVLQLADYALQSESLEQLLADLTLLDSLEAEDVVEGAEPDEKLTLSSVHQAKGLEWRAVFLIWLADGRFPSAPALRAPDGEEEERRLFYVAVTRAKDELYLTYPIMQEERDQARLLLRPSRFVDELPVQPPPYEKWSIEVAPEAKLLEE
ncbi:MAG TPA: ATP-dependent helicase [Myxococcales bacterium]|nr:ATP-dependent helicase [Myxococcales bacterium]